MNRAAASYAAENALIPFGSVDIHSAYGLIIAVKGAGVHGCACADRHPLCRCCTIGIRAVRIKGNARIQVDIRHQPGVCGCALCIDLFIRIACERAVYDIPEQGKLIRVIYKVICDRAAVFIFLCYLRKTGAHNIY